VERGEKEKEKENINGKGEWERRGESCLLHLAEITISIC